MDEFATGGQPTAANAPVSLLLTMLPLRIADEVRSGRNQNHHIYIFAPPELQKSPGCAIAMLCRVF